jgi:hypothetical protein
VQVCLAFVDDIRLTNPPNPFSTVKPVDYSLFSGFVHLGAGLACGFTGMAAGYAIGIVGDSVRGFCFLFYTVESFTLLRIHAVRPGVCSRTENIRHHGVDPDLCRGVGFVWVRNAFPLVPPCLLTNKTIVSSSRSS